LADLTPSVLLNFNILGLTYIRGIGIDTTGLRGDDKQHYYSTFWINGTKYATGNREHYDTMHTITTIFTSVKNSLNQDNHASLFPNPSSSEFTIIDAEERMWNVYDVNGKYMTTIFSNKKTLHGLGSGVYSVVSNTGQSLKIFVGR
jgi:hypothetical protein